MGGIFSSGDAYAACNLTLEDLGNGFASEDWWSQLHMAFFILCLVYTGGFLLRFVIPLVHHNRAELNYSLLWEDGYNSVAALMLAIYCFFSIPSYFSTPTAAALRVVMFGSYAISLAFTNHIQVSLVANVRAVAFADTGIKPPKFAILRRFEATMCIIPGYLTFIAICVYAGSGCHSSNNHFRLMAFGYAIGFITLQMSWLSFGVLAVKTLGKKPMVKGASSDKWERKVEKAKRKIMMLTAGGVYNYFAATAFSVLVAFTSLVDDVPTVGYVNRTMAVVLQCIHFTVIFTIRNGSSKASRQGQHKSGRTGRSSQVVPNSSANTISH